MKFIIEHISKTSGRLGQLVHNDSHQKYKTPLLLQTTKGGSIPFMSREVFNYVSQKPHVLQMSLVSMYQMTESLALYKDTASSYVGFKDYPTVLLIRDPCEVMPSGSNDRDYVPLFTRHGKIMITPERYMQTIETFATDIYQGLSDVDTNEKSSNKRIRKSVNRTNIFMKHCYEQQAKSERLKKCTLYAPIVGGYSKFARDISIKEAQRPEVANIYGGYILEGFHNYGLTATTVNGDQLLEIVKHCVAQLDVNKPRLMPGAYTPPLVLELISLGVDMFDSSYVYCAAINFKALTFSFVVTQLNVNVPFLDVTDDSLKEDFTPILQDCNCLTCRKHTRAYVHHLYKTKELLGPMLLMIHNLHHYIGFFESIHECILTDKLPALINLIKYQANSVKKLDYCIYQNQKVIEQEVLDKNFQAYHTNTNY